MSGFREQHKFVIYLINFSGLYMKSIEYLTNSKLIIYFLTVYTKFSIIILPIFLASSFKLLVFDEGSFSFKISICRKVIAFGSSFVKVVFFYVHQKKIENLIDKWDSLFKENLYAEDREKKMKRSRRVNSYIIITIWTMSFLGALCFTLPQFFSTSKKLNHPTGLPYREMSPDYELMTTFFFFRVMAGALTTAALDAILITFLSLVIVQLSHLRDSLEKMIEEGISLDPQGHVTFAVEPKQTDSAAVLPFVGNQTIDNVFLKDEENVSAYRKTIDEFDEKIRIWLMHHQQIIRFFDEMSHLFSPVVSIQLLLVILYTCFTAFHLVRAKFGVEFFVIIFISLGILSSLFVFCYLGGRAETASRDIFGAAFDRGWYLYPKKIRTAFAFVLMTTRRPLLLRGVSVFKINLHTFHQVIKVTYQLIAFLLQVNAE